jgi:foldase protein PrsA
MGGCGSRPAAIVNGTKITESDLNRQLRKASGAQMLATLIDMQIIRDGFAATKLPLTQEDINASIDNQFGDLQHFQQLAAQQGIDTEDYVERVIKPQIMMAKLATQDLKVTDQALKDFYAKNKQRYDQPEMVAYAVIVTAQKADAEKALAALKGGADFATVVRQYSIDPQSRESGGQIPSSPITQVPKPVADVLKSLKEGQHSGVTQIDTLFAILRLDKRTPAHSFTFEQVKSRVEKDYRESQLTPQKLVALRDKLRKDAKVAVVDSEFQALNETYRSLQIPEFGEGLTSPAGAAPSMPPVESAPATSAGRASAAPAGQPPTGP